MTELVKQLSERWEGNSAWALLTTIVSVVIATLISKKLDARWKHVYERDIERFKDRMEQDRLVSNTALSSLNAASSAANPKIVAAVESVWAAMLKLREASSDTGYFADLTTKEEWCGLPSRPRQAERVLAIAEGGAARQRLMEELAAVENVRPFVGELIWSMFFVYRALVLRVAVIIERNLSRRTLPYWYEDNGIQEFTRPLLTTEEIALVERYPINRHRQLTAMAEAKNPCRDEPHSRRPSLGG